MESNRTETFDAWSDYCAKSSELEWLILDSCDLPFSRELQKRIERKRKELDAILDTMIGGVCRERTESKNTAGVSCAKGA